MLYKFDGKVPTVGKGTCVSDIARIIGDVVIGSNCYIGHGAILRGDYGRIEIGDGTAVEEGVIVHAPPLFALSAMVFRIFSFRLDFSLSGDRKVPSTYL